MLYRIEGNWTFEPIYKNRHFQINNVGRKTFKSICHIAAMSMIPKSSKRSRKNITIARLRKTSTKTEIVRQYDFSRCVGS